MFWHVCELFASFCWYCPRSLHSVFAPISWQATADSLLCCSLSCSCIISWPITLMQRCRLSITTRLARQQTHYHALSLNVEDLCCCWIEVYSLVLHGWFFFFPTEFTSLYHRHTHRTCQHRWWMLEGTSFLIYCFFLVLQNQRLPHHKHQLCEPIRPLIFRHCMYRYYPEN